MTTLNLHFLHILLNRNWENEIMNQRLEVGDKIVVYTKDGRQHTGTYCYLPSGYVGILEQRLAIPLANIKKIILKERKH